MLDTSNIDTELFDSCTGGTDKLGCFNGVAYDYGAEMPCGKYLTDYYNHGCCPTDDEGLTPYNLHKDSCCVLDGKHQVIKGNAHACTCSKTTGSCGEDSSMPAFML